MKHPLSLPSLVAAFCLALPATGLSHDHQQERSDWHGHYYGHHGHFYGPWLPPLPFFGGWPFYGCYDPSVGVSVATEPAPAYRSGGARVDDQGDELTVEVQRALHHEGYYRGEVDGDLGSGTRAAIRRYQSENHLDVTGRIDRTLLRSLGID